MGANPIVSYKISMSNLLRKLDVKNLANEKYENITSKIEKSGSDKPRAILAYFFSILYTIDKYSSSIFCPLIIDSPNQQAQDKTNMKKIMELVTTGPKEDWQLILAVESMHGVNFPGEIIELSEKLHVLLKSEFTSVSSIFENC